MQIVCRGKYSRPEILIERVRAAPFVCRCGVSVAVAPAKKIKNGISDDVLLKSSLIPPTASRSSIEFMSSMKLSRILFSTDVGG